MDIGIKFCGGCNPRYNRIQCVEKIKAKFPEHSYVTQKDKKICDIWLIICGCSRSCADSEDLISLKKKFILKSFKDFDMVRDYLEKEQNEIGEEEDIKWKNPINDKLPPALQGRKELILGEKKEMNRTITQEDLISFAKLTGDYNRMHMDKEFAAKQWFLNPVVHGVFVASFISTIMGMDLPGSGTILMKEELEFLKPAFIGDKITTEVTFSRCEEYKRHYIGEFKGICKNQNGDILVQGKCTQMMMKNLFLVKNLA